MRLFNIRIKQNIPGLRGIIAKARRLATPIEQVHETILVVEHKRRQVFVVLDPVVDLVRPGPQIQALAHAVGYAISIAEEVLVQRDVREGGHLGQDLAHGGVAARAVPAGVPQVVLVKVDERTQAAVAVAQVSGLDGGVDGPGVRGGLRVRPLGPAVQKLKAVVVEPAAEGQAAREGARAQQAQCLGPNHLVDVGHDDDVAILRLAHAALEAWKDLRQHGVALEVLAVPGAGWVVARRVLQLVVDELVVVRGEALPVLLDD